MAIIKIDCATLKIRTEILKYENMNYATYKSEYGKLTQQVLKQDLLLNEPIHSNQVHMLTSSY